ncbi:MAG TPA: protein DpdJ [Propionicimonas sp.]|jgi:hypothetical protein
MSVDPWAGVPDLLSRLEDLELPLLAWGVVDGFLSREDVESAINAQLDADADDPGALLHSVDDYLQHMLDAGLLHRVPDPAPRYRTRLAETLRLLRTLRQLWPPSDASAQTWWSSSSRLVADYRLRVSPRRYPKREITTDGAIARLAGVPGWSQGHGDVLKRIVGDAKLAKFQVDATGAVLAGLDDPHATGRIITAGTGSGKTLAFYIPALLDIAATANQARKGPHTLALYPRNELLRDQVREAVLTSRRLGPISGPGTRHVRIGVLYGDTPEPRDFDLAGGRSAQKKKWQRTGQGWASPYFPCLTEGCRGSLLWLDADRTSGVERLTCDTCATTTPVGALALTRESIRRNPPDILFSSTEMLSKQATGKLASVLGWKGPVGVRMVLLDEVHTYAGVHGAQVGLMLRRWRHANRQWGKDSPEFVGLSATLRDAGDFFANLTGVERSNVELIAPAADDLAAISREYGVVLRGDPISGTALLSTTIQTAMLVERVMDPKPGIYGSVTFAFTDQLDSINRLYDNLSDAEGHQPRGRAAGQVLATLRDPAAPQAGPRYVDGQSWDLPAHLQRMGRGLRVARTTSQDTGVNADADIVVATASLEVGFNDPRVGAVIQHKAPRDLASFLQRRGRAGRRLEMRPMTLVVLSDYGRDRIAYQTYEKLLDPEIDARTLPIGNRFVIKMQATHSLLDWISKRTGADARAVLAPPDGTWAPRNSGDVKSLLAKLLDDSALQDELAEHLRYALGLSAEEAQAALWEEPRSLVLSVVPTALRRLESAWTPMVGQTDAGAIPWTPLPEFMTGALFGALNTPDVTFELPPNFGEEPEPMAIAQALREAVPGRVSRRYGYAHATLSSWLPVPDVGDELPLQDVIVRGRRLGQWSTSDGEVYNVVRPLALGLKQPPGTISDTSNAQPVWRTSFEIPQDALIPGDMPTPSLWSDFVNGCSFALHVGGGPLTVRRMAIGSEGELSYRNGTSRPVHVRYVDNGAPAALGYELDVDAFVVDGQLPEDLRTHLGDFPESPAGRTLVFRRLVQEDPRLDDIANTFQREWLTQAYLHAFVGAGHTADVVSTIPDLVSGGRWTTDFAQFLAVAYRADGSGQLTQSRTLASLTALAAHPAVQSVIEDNAQVLVAGDVASRSPDLLARVFRDTLASAILAATEEGLPDANEGDLAVDVEVGPDSRGFRVYVSETSIGGLGLIEQLHRDYVQDPRRFWDAVARALSPTEAEDVDRAMQAFVEDVATSGTQLEQRVQAFRSASSVAAMDRALRDLLHVWASTEGPPSHLLVSTLAARTLRPGSTRNVDSILSSLTSRWIEEESRLGIEIDARTLAYHAAEGHLGVGISPLNSDGVFSLLWLRGPHARTQRLEHWDPYRQDVVIERLALASALGQPAPEVDVTREGWLVEFMRLMVADGRARLTAPYALRARLAAGIREATVHPIERNGLRTYARVTAVRQRQGSVEAELSLAEELQ